MPTSSFKTRRIPLIKIALLISLFSITIGAGVSVGDDNKLYLPTVHSSLSLSATGDWPTVAGNPERTSRTTTEVTGNLVVSWYRPIEAYIQQHSQVIAANGILYISTSAGLYALNAHDGSLMWRYDTELPLGNSPTVSNGVVYVGGYDRKLHALDAYTGAHLWAFSGAKAGYDTSPLVVDGKVILGNRDGTMYAIGAHGSTNQGQQIWKYTTGGAIHLSAAYKDGVVFFASNDNYAYALNADSGNLVWRSSQLPSLQFHSYWPVIYRDKVIFTGAFGYRSGSDPGTQSVKDPSSGDPAGNYKDMQLLDLFPTMPEGTIVGEEVAPRGWAHGYPVIDASRITEYLEDNPDQDPYKHKPWRRIHFVLNQSDGSEFTFDSDNDSYPEYFPGSWFGSNTGNAYPPTVGPDDILYLNNIYLCCSDEKGIIMGWNIDDPGVLSVTGGFHALGAIAEPQAISIGGNTVYRDRGNDQQATYYNLMDPSGRRGTIHSWNLYRLAPGYDPMWKVYPEGIWRLFSFYKGVTDTVNGAYFDGGDQNPLVPHQDGLYSHNGNTIMAFGPSAGPGLLPPILIQPAQDSGSSLSELELTSRLESEIQKIVDAGHLRPGYYNVSPWRYPGLEDYFSNPGDTLYTLAQAYPHLSPELQTSVQAFLQDQFERFFDNEMYATIGWDTGAARESMILPPEVEADLANHPALARGSRGWIWQYPQHNFYAMWKYAEIFPQQASLAYGLAKNKLQVPVPVFDPPFPPQNEYFQQQPFELNAWIAGYIGFLELQELAGMDVQDAQLRTQVTNELNRLLQLRVSIFSKDSYWPDGFNWYKKHLDLSRNFIFLVPELADYLAQHIPDQVQQALDEYEYIAPYWFVSRYESTLGEGVMANLYTYNALFLAKSLILNEPQQELSKYLDVPAFERGDLFYIQNLVTAIEAPGINNLDELALLDSESCPLLNHEK